MDQKGSPASWKEGEKKKKNLNQTPKPEKKRKGKKKHYQKKNTVNGESRMGSGGIKFSPLVWKQTGWGTTSG